MLKVSSKQLPGLTGITQLPELTGITQLLGKKLRASCELGKLCEPWGHSGLSLGALRVSQEQNNIFDFFISF